MSPEAEKMILIANLFFDLVSVCDDDITEDDQNTLWEGVMAMNNIERYSQEEVALIGMMIIKKLLTHITQDKELDSTLVGYLRDSFREMVVNSDE